MSKSHSVSYRRGWLRAIFDGEGSVSYNRRTGVWNLTCSQKPGDVLNRIQQFLTAEGISFGVHRTDSSAMSVAIQNQANLKRFARKIGFTDRRKARLLRQIIADKERLLQPTKVRVPRLRYLLSRGVSYRKAARILGVSKQTIRRRAEQFGLREQAARLCGKTVGDLRRMYWYWGWDQTRIAAELGSSQATVSRFMREQEIPTRHARDYDRKTA